jgi:uncharacterized protein (DUF885 family)
MRRAWTASVALLLVACQPEAPPAKPAAEDPSPAEVVNDIADRYYEWRLARTPESAYFAAIELDRHDGLYDNSLAALEKEYAFVDGLLAEIAEVDGSALQGSPEWIAYTLLERELQSLVALRICRNELWSVNQMGGWHLWYPQIATLQPVDTPEHRTQAVARFSKLPASIDTEIENLRAGLEQGYSAPKSVVRRVAAQVGGLLAAPVEESPFYSMAKRSDDPAFGRSVFELIEQQINPALQRYQAFLESDYIEGAREQLSITANPNGAECYAASLQHYTTLSRSGQEVYELGQSTVAANKASVIEIGQSVYELTDFVEIIERAKNDPNDRFASREELLEFSKDAVRRAEKEMPNWVGHMPEQAAKVVPFPPHEEGTGRSAHYFPGNEERAGEYRIPLDKPEDRSRGNSESTAFHEVWPGHHLQIATFNTVEGLHPVTSLIWFSGPGEGWARYSEGLAEEMGLYQTATGPILRRAWPARGMVVDPGIHLFGWTREEAIDFMMESGRFPESMGDDLVDRIAILPGQLTAYDSGGLEILALRRQAEEALGDNFDIREFHDRVLENGTIPLGYLRQHIDAWIASKQD